MDDGPGGAEGGHDGHDVPPVLAEGHRVHDRGQEDGIEADPGSHTGQEGAGQGSGPGQVDGAGLVEQVGLEGDAVDAVGL